MYSMTGTLVRDLGGGWCLRRWEYDGAPLELHGPGGCVTIVHEGDELELTVTYTDHDHFGGAHERELRQTVPVSVLMALLEAK